jgi:hypothetical protein
MDRYDQPSILFNQIDNTFRRVLAFCTSLVVCHGYFCFKTSLDHLAGSGAANRSNRRRHPLGMSQAT